MNTYTLVVKFKTDSKMREFDFELFFKTLNKQYKEAGCPNNSSWEFVRVEKKDG